MKQKKPQHRDVLIVDGLKFKKGTGLLDKDCWVRMVGKQKFVLFYSPKHTRECEFGCCADRITPAHWSARVLVEISRRPGKKYPNKTPDGRTLYAPDEVKSSWFTKEAKTYGIAYRMLIGHIAQLAEVLRDLHLDLNGEKR